MMTQIKGQITQIKSDKRIIIVFLESLLLFILICPLGRASQDLKDPFISPFELKIDTIKKPDIKPPLQKDLPNLQVQGMIWNSQAPQAIINDTVLKIGEAVEGAKILDINKDGVYLLYKGRRYIIKPKLK